MRYGYFDLPNKEYVIDCPNTPTPWTNYLGNPKFGAVISNNAAGYTFEENGAEGRIIRHYPNALIGNMPGRFIYIYDKDKRDYFSNTWYPVMKPLDKYKSEVRMGTGYMSARANYDNIQTETLYYVPKDKKREVWSFKIKNNDSVKRDFYITGFCEFTNEGNFTQDMANLQYTHLISKTIFKDNAIINCINDNMNESRFVKDENYREKTADHGYYRILALAGGEVCAYDGDRETFIGAYHSYSNPQAIENGKLSNTLSYNQNSCGAAQTEVSLEPGEEKHLVFVLAQLEEKNPLAITANYTDLSVVDKEFTELKNYWHEKLSKFSVKTPDETLDNAVNVWNAYQCYITFTWSRSASLIYNTGRDGYGYRDTVQDIQGIIHFAPEEALEKIKFMLMGQFQNGGALPVVRFDHKPGGAVCPDDPKFKTGIDGHGGYRADDMLWMFPTIDKYIKEVGDVNILDEVLGYADKGEGTVYEHLKKAIGFNLDRLGVHGLPMGLTADWNDCLRLGSDGETVFVAFQLYWAIKIFKGYAEYKGNAADVDWASKVLAELTSNMQKHAWDEDRFVRGFVGDDFTIGARNSEEANIWLNPQSFAVLSDWDNKEQTRLANDTAYNALSTKFGMKIMAPSFTKFGLPYARMTMFNPGSKENGGLFSQIQGWAVNAQARLGNGLRAYEIYTKCNPGAMNDQAEVRKIEPYVHGQSIESYESNFEGRAQVSWLTGTATTVMVGLVEGVLGIRPDFDGIKIDPCLPQWEEISIYKEWRGKKLNISVKNPEKIEKNVKNIIINGEKIDGNYIPFEKLANENEIVVNMGR